MGRWQIRRPGYATCASVLAIALATTGSALAAKAKVQYSGGHVRNESLTGLDFQNRSLTNLDFASTVKGARGADGDAGPSGPEGTKGLAGFAGPKGPKGVDAGRQFSFSYREADSRFSTIVNPNGGFAPWYVRNAISSSKSPELLNTSGLIMTDLTQSQQSGGVLELRWPSKVVVASTTTLLHRGDARCDDGSATRSMSAPSSSSASCATSGVDVTPDEADDVDVHTRVECWVEYADIDGASPRRMGERLMASAVGTEQLVNFPVTAGTTLPAGRYTFRTMCRMADRTPDSTHDDWEFVHANMSVLAAADWDV
jgi:hypothetical protein